MSLILLNLFPDIAPGRGTNRNEALHRCLNNLFTASKIGVRLAYALLMIIFDKMNHKEDKKNRILEKGVVDEARRRIINKGCSPHSTSDINQEDFGIGVNASSQESKSIDMSSSKTKLCYNEAINIIEKAANAVTTFTFLSSISKASTLSPKQFPFF
jgi:hypothetical protein